MKRVLSTLSATLFLAAPTWADRSAGHDGMHHAGMNHDAMSGAFSAGLVRKVDKDRGKLTLRHGPLSNLDMPAMTMIFRVTEPAWLEQVKPGDHIHFQADKVNGKLTVTRLEVVQ